MGGNHLIKVEKHLIKVEKCRTGKGPARGWVAVVRGERRGRAQKLHLG